MLEITDAARRKLLEIWEGKKATSIGLLVGISGRSANGFEYVMRFLEKDEDIDYELVTTLDDDMQVVIDRESISTMKGSTIDFVAVSSGFRIDNPNPVWVWDNPIEQAVQDVLTQQVNPQIASHGGSVQLLEVRDNVAYIKMGGGCVGCGLVDVTLKQGVEVAIKEAVPEIESIVDTTDHASGTNPYYQETKGGGGGHQPAKGGAPHQPAKGGGDEPRSPFD